MIEPVGLVGTLLEVDGFGEDAPWVDGPPQDVLRLPRREWVTRLTHATARPKAIKHRLDVLPYVLSAHDVLPPGAVIVDAHVLDVISSQDDDDSLTVAHVEPTTTVHASGWGVRVPPGRGVRLILAGGQSHGAYRVTVAMRATGDRWCGGVLVVEVVE